MKILTNSRKELFLKEQRVAYWEKHHCIPAIPDLMNEGGEKI